MEHLTTVIKRGLYSDLSDLAAQRGFTVDKTSTEDLCQICFTKQARSYSFNIESKCVEILRTNKGEETTYSYEPSSEGVVKASIDLMRAFISI